MLRARVRARTHTHTHTHTCKQSHFHIFKTVFLSLFGFEKSIFRYITMKKVWCYMVWLPQSQSLKTELGKGCTHHSPPSCMVNICHCLVLVKEHTDCATIIRSVTALFGPLDAAVLWYFDTVYSTSKWLVLDPVMGLTSEVDHSYQQYFISAISTDQSHSWEINRCLAGQ